MCSGCCRGHEKGKRTSRLSSRFFRTREADVPSAGDWESCGASAGTIACGLARERGPSRRRGRHRRLNSSPALRNSAANIPTARAIAPTGPARMQSSRYKPAKAIAWCPSARACSHPPMSMVHHRPSARPHRRRGWSLALHGGSHLGAGAMASRTRASMDVQRYDFL